MRRFGGDRPLGAVLAALRFLARTKLDLSPIQTHFFDLTNGVEAFEFGKNPAACIKVTLTNAA